MSLDQGKYIIKTSFYNYEFIRNHEYGFSGIIVKEKPNIIINDEELKSLAIDSLEDSKMFFIESSLRKWLKYVFVLMILCISILLIFEIYGKYIVINDFQVQQKYEAQYNQYIKRVNQQREEFKEFLNF